jgi:hypothetical protein
MVILHFRERPPFQREIGAHKKFGGSIKETVSLAKHVDSPGSKKTNKKILKRERDEETLQKAITVLRDKST